MIANRKSIEIIQYKHYRAIHMKWSADIDRRSIKMYFDELCDILDAENDPLCVVVDLRENKFMPLIDTFKAVIAEAHGHPKLATWLVLGENSFARPVAAMLNRFGQATDIMWFDNEIDMDDYLEEVCPYA